MLTEQGKGSLAMADETVNTLLARFKHTLIDKKLAKRGIPDTTQYAIDCAHLQSKIIKNRPDPVIDNHIIKQ